MTLSNAEYGSEYQILVSVIVCLIAVHLLSVLPIVSNPIMTKVVIILLIQSDI